MYRNAAQSISNNVVISNSKPSPGQLINAVDDTKELLRQKRKQLDDEIASFKAIKDQEFRDFEKSLKRQRSKRRKGLPSEESASSSQTDRRPAALSLLGVANDQPNTNGSTTKPRRQDTKRPKAVPASHPTLSLTRSNISGESTPPRSLRSASPDRSPIDISTLSLSPQRRRPTNPSTPPSSAPSREDCFTSIFTPAYLPLLDSHKPKSINPPRSEALNHTSSTTPITFGPNIPQSSYSLPKSNSTSLSPIARGQRSQTEPAIASTSLPSALRTASGTQVRRRKKVTFQLADNAIVEPSSSYEELPSPDPRVEHKEGLLGIDGLVVNSSEEHRDEVEEVEDVDVGDGWNGWVGRDLRSPTIRGRERAGSVDSSVTVTRTGFGEGLKGIDGGSGVGFFELDEELESPGTVEGVGFDEENGMESLDPGEDEEVVTEKQTYEYGGSVPIDIVRPSSSWVGSFGH